MVVFTGRPRIWLLPTSLTALKARAVPANDRWNTLKDLVDRVEDPSWDVGIPNYALAYLVTGNAAYAQKAWTLLEQSMSAGLTQVTPDSGYHCRDYFPSASLCLDWLHDWASAAQRARLIADLETNALWVWPETNPARADSWAITNPLNNYYHGFMMSWIAGLALAGESGKSQGIIDRSLSRWNTVIIPALAGPCAGGFTPEGSNYGVASAGFMLQYLLAHQTAAGEDLITPNPWFGDMVTAMIHLTTPTLTEMAPLGDIGVGPINDNHRRAMLLMAGRDPRAQVWLDHVNPNRCLQRGSAWLEFLFASPAVPTGFPRDNSTFYSLPGTGIISSRSGWGRDDTQLLFKCGPTRESHEERAIGAFFLYRGDWIASTAKMRSHSGIAQGVEDYCCISVEGAPQDWTQDQAKIIAQEDTPEYTYLKGDVAGAYTKTLKSYTRELFFLKPNFLLVRDLFNPISPTASALWHLHTLEPVTLSFDSVSWASGRLFARVLIPTLPHVVTAPFEATVDQPVLTYRTDLSKGAVNAFSVALEAAGLGQFPRSLGEDRYSPGLTGINTPSGFMGYVVGTGPWSYKTPVAGVQTLFGFKPSTVYSTPGTMTTSSPAGVLRFSATDTVTIAEGEPIPPPVPTPVPTPVPVPPTPVKARQFVVIVPEGGTATITEVTK